MKPAIFHARYVFPVSGPPIHGGAVAVEAGRIAGVGGAAAFGPAVDLGNVALLPGLVNAHTHLELSDLDAPLAARGTEFVAWIRAVMAWRRKRDDEGLPAGAPRAAVERGLAECARCGTVAVGDIAQPGWSSEPFERAGIDSTVFQELIGTSPERAERAFESAVGHAERLGSSPHWTPGLSPHAPYSVSFDLLRRAVALSQSARLPIAMHLAESREEIEWLRSDGGPLRELLQDLGAWRPGRFGGGRPLDYLHALAQADRALVIHGNYLDDEEIAFLAAHRRRMAVVYCPRTHAWFGHDPYPLARMLAAGVTVALGTDSRASSPDLSLLAEMQDMARRHPEIEPRAVLEIATLGGARALGREHSIGSLAPGKRAGLAVVALPEGRAADPHELLVDPAARASPLAAAVPGG